MSPPVSSVAPAPQQQQQQQQRQQAKPRDSGGGPFPKAVPGAEPQTQTPAQKRAAKRARQRLAKAGRQEAASEATTANLSPAAKAAAALQEVTTLASAPTERPAGSLTAELTAEMFRNKKGASKKIQVEQHVQDNVARLSHLASLVTLSLQGEYLPAPPAAPEGETPAQRELKLKKAADELLDDTLAKQGSSSLSGPLALQKAEAELAVTNRALQPLLDAGLPNDDQVVKLLRDKQATQTTAISKLKAGAPSVAAQKVALAVGKQKLLEQQTLLDDRVASGKKAAQERMNVRDQLLVQLTAFIDQLSEATDAADSQLAAAHDAKTQARKETLQKALELCGQRELALEDVVFLDADACTHTATEKERDEAQAAATEHKAINDNLQGQLARLQQETSAAVQQANLQQQQQDQTHQQQLQAQLQAQQAAAPAAATTAEAAAQEQAAAAASAAAAAATEAKANADWLTGFPAEETQLPPKPTTPPDEQQSAFLIRLIMLKQAAKFASLPRMSFEQLQVAPWFMHRLVGDAIWKAC